MNKLKIIYNYLLKLFKLANIFRVFIVFLVGFISRFLVNYYFGIDVFIQFTSPISIIYYTLFSAFVVYISELFNYLSIINFNFLDYCFSYIFRILFNVEFKDFISDIADLIRGMKNNDSHKLTIGSIKDNINNPGSKSILNDLNLMMGNSEGSSKNSSDLSIKEIPKIEQEQLKSKFSDSTTESTTDKEIRKYNDKYTQRIKDIKDRSENVELDIIHKYDNCVNGQQVRDTHEHFNRIIKSDAAKYIEEIKFDAHKTKLFLAEAKNISSNDKRILMNKIDENTQNIVRQEGENVKRLSKSNDTSFILYRGNDA